MERSETRASVRFCGLVHYPRNLRDIHQFSDLNALLGTCPKFLRPVCLPGKCLSALAMDVCLPCLLFTDVLPEACSPSILSMVCLFANHREQGPGTATGREKYIYYSYIIYRHAYVRKDVRTYVRAHACTDTHLHSFLLHGAAGAPRRGSGWRSEVILQNIPSTFTSASLRKIGAREADFSLLLEGWQLLLWPFAYASVTCPHLQCEECMKLSGTFSV